MPSRNDQAIAKVVERVKEAGGLPLKSRWPNTDAIITPWELSLVRMAQHRDLLPKGQVQMDYLDEISGGPIEKIEQPEPADLPYEVTPAILALRERKRRLGR